MGFLAEFRKWEDVVEFSAQSVIFSEGDPADVMYVILSGEVELTLHGEALGTEETGGIIGEIAMLKSTTRSSTITALTDTKLARLNHDQFQECIGRNSEFSLHVMAVLASRLRSVDKYISTKLDKSK